MSTHAPHPSRPVPWTVLVLMAVAQFMVILDVTVVNVALPSISEDLAFAPADLAWVVTAYVLLTGGLMLLGGRAADALGRRRVFLAGLVGFTAASLASGLATSPGMLVAARAAQGLGAAFLLPAALSTVTATYEGAQRAKALAVWGAIGAAGGAAGLLLGGMLTTWLGWRSVFLINVPVGALTGARGTAQRPGGARGRRPARPRRRAERDRRPRRAAVRLLRRGRARLGLGSHARPVRRRRGSARGLRGDRAPRGAAARPARDLARALAELQRGRHARRHRRARRRLLPQLALCAAGARRLGAGDRAGVPAVRDRHRPGRRTPASTCSRARARAWSS